LKTQCLKTQVLKLKTQGLKTQYLKWFIEYTLNTLFPSIINCIERWLEWGGRRNGSASGNLTTRLTRWHMKYRELGNLTFVKTSLLLISPMLQLTTGRNIQIFYPSLEQYFYMSKMSNAYTPTTFHCGQAISFFDFSSNYWFWFVAFILKGFFFWIPSTFLWCEICLRLVLPFQFSDVGLLPKWSSQKWSSINWWHVCRKKPKYEEIWRKFDLKTVSEL
jgi:hypothetical protein